VETVTKMMMMVEGKTKYNGDTTTEDAEKALSYGRVRGQKWTRDNSWCGGSKIKYSCRNFLAFPNWLFKQFLTVTKDNTIVKLLCEFRTFNVYYKYVLVF